MEDLALAVYVCDARAISFEEFTIWLDQYVARTDDPPLVAFDLMEHADFESWRRSDAVMSLRQGVASPSEYATVQALFVMRAPCVIDALKARTDDRYMSLASAKALASPQDPFVAKIRKVLDTVDFDAEQSNPTPLTPPGK